MKEQLSTFIDHTDAAIQRAKRGLISCPKCATLAVRGGRSSWAYAVAWLLTLCLFPYGLLGWLAPVLAPRKPTRCPRCAFTWVV